MTASELPGIYRDGVRTEVISRHVLMKLAERVAGSEGGAVDDVRIGEDVFSPAEQFDLFARALAGGGELRSRNVLGPDSAPHDTDLSLGTIPRSAFDVAVKDANEFVEVNHRMPADVFVGSQSVSPAEFLMAMANILRSGTNTPETVSLPSKVLIRTERYVANDDGRPVQRVGDSSDGISPRTSWRSPSFRRGH